MKKKNIIYIIFISLLFCISILFRISYAYEYEDEDLTVKIKVASVTKNSYEREFEVVYENKEHTLKVVSDYYKEFYEPEDSPSKNKMILYFDDKEVRDFKLDVPITDFRNLPISVDLKKENFHFISGVNDGKIYLGVEFGNKLTIFNSNGEVLKHKPFEKELDYFDSNIGNSWLIDKDGKEIKNEYFYKLDGEYSSVCIKNNKIYSFVVAPDELDFFAPLDKGYLYENEYVINNDEIYFKNLNKYEIYRKET